MALHDWKNEPPGGRFPHLSMPGWRCSRCKSFVISSRMPVSFWEPGESRVALAYYDGLEREVVLRDGQLSGDCDEAVVWRVMRS